MTYADAVRELNKHGGSIYCGQSGLYYGLDKQGAIHNLHPGPGGPPGVHEVTKNNWEWLPF